MFIRSQDRKILTEIHDVEIDSANQIWGSGSLIGEYSTKEKALKVIDMIQKYVVFNSYEVFIMPQDDEVEV